MDHERGMAGTQRVDRGRTVAPEHAVAVPTFSQANRSQGPGTTVLWRDATIAGRSLAALARFLNNGGRPWGTGTIGREGAEEVSMLGLRIHRMRTFAVMASLAVAVSGLGALSTLHAQGPPGAVVPGPGGAAPGMGMGMGGGQGGAIMVLLAPSVQKELKLSEKQKADVYNFAKTAGQKSRETMQAMAFSGNNGNPQAMMEALMQLRLETDQGLAKILEPKQKERLDQIVLQSEGPLSVARPEIAAKLRMNDEQQEYVQGVMMQMRRQLNVARFQGAANGQPISPAQVRSMTTQLRKEAVKEISKVIDRKQKAAFEKMLGEPFDITKLESETAAVDPTGAPAQTGDAAAPGTTTATADTEKEKEIAKEAPSASRKKGRTKSKSGANP
jgi:hypothetical protein